MGGREWLGVRSSIWGRILTSVCTAEQCYGSGLITEGFRGCMFKLSCFSGQCRRVRCTIRVSLDRMVAAGPLSRGKDLAAHNSENKFSEFMAACFQIHPRGSGSLDRVRLRSRMGTLSETVTSRSSWAPGLGSFGVYKGNRPD